MRPTTALSATGGELFTIHGSHLVAGRWNSMDSDVIQGDV